MPPRRAHGIGLSRFFTKGYFTWGVGGSVQGSGARTHPGGHQGGEAPVAGAVWRGQRGGTPTCSYSWWPCELWRMPTKIMYAPTTGMKTNEIFFHLSVSAAIQKGGVSPRGARHQKGKDKPIAGGHPAVGRAQLGQRC